MRANASGNLKVMQGKLIARKRKQFIYKVIFTLFFVSLFVFGLAWLSQLTFFSVDEIKVINEKPEEKREINSTVIIADVQRLLAGNYFYFFSKNNVFIYPKHQVLNYLVDLPAIKYVELKVNRSVNEVIIKIEERSEEMRWCEDGVDALCYSADEKGFIYATSTFDDSYFSTSSIIFRGALEEGVVPDDSVGPIGKNILPEDDFERIQFFIRELGLIGLTIREVVFGETSYITVILTDGGRLIVNSADDLTSVLTNVEVVLNEKDISSSLEYFLKNLDYMRLDGGNKIFYKLRNSASSVGTTTQ